MTIFRYLKEEEKIKRLPLRKGFSEFPFVGRKFSFYFEFACCTTKANGASPQTLANILKNNQIDYEFIIDMKEIIHLPKKYNYILIIGFTAIVVTLIVFFTINAIKYDHMLETLQNSEFNGLIKDSKKEPRDFYYIMIKDNISKTCLKYSLPTSWFFLVNKIQIGDSVSKNANSKMITFYKLKNGVFEKCCDYEVKKFYDY